jgi:hypothetical protein
MSKYKICKFTNGIGEEWYQIQKRGLLFWYYVWAYKGGAPEFSPRKVIMKFYTIEQAQGYIKEHIQYEQQGKIKKVECFDYDV